METEVTQLAAIVVLGIFANWACWRWHLPSVVLLLVIGIVVGPLLGFLNPDEMFGKALLPMVSLSVAVILFEGGLSLKVAELREGGGAVFRLVFFGVLFTWILGSLWAYSILGLPLRVAILLGAILVVSGPTVITPILRILKLRPALASVVKWEGILNDPVGALLAVLVFEGISQGNSHTATASLTSIILTVVVGSLVGVAGAAFVAIGIRRFWGPDFLDTVFALAVVFAVFVTANSIQREAGLFAVTLMGIVLANQKFVDVRRIIEFKESLRVILIASLFIVLSARLSMSDLARIDARLLLFLILMVIITRPVAVGLSTLGTPLSRADRLFLMWMAPRGIVAAAVASVFALQLERAGFENARYLATATFVTIFFTTVVYGLSGRWVAKALGVSRPETLGVLIVGGDSLGLGIASALQKAGVPTVLVDSDPRKVAKASQNGIEVVESDALSEELPQLVRLECLSKLMAVTSNDEVNSLAALHFREFFGSREVYQLPSTFKTVKGGRVIPNRLGGRPLFRNDATHAHLISRLSSGSKIITAPIPETPDPASPAHKILKDGLPMFLVSKSGGLRVYTPDYKPQPRPGDLLIGMLPG